MAYIDYKVTSVDLLGKKVTHQSDVLVGSPSENKQVFDNYPDVITTKYNGLIDDLVANPPVTPTVLFPVSSIIATDSATAPTHVTGTWAELTGLTLTLTEGASTKTIHLWVRTA